MKHDKVEMLREKEQGSGHAPFKNGSPPEDATAHDLLTQLLQNIDAAIYTCDHQGRITMYNEAAARLWGRRPRIGEDMWCGSWKIFRQDGSQMDLSECPMAIALKEGRPVDGQEIVVERPDGVRRNILPHPKPLFNELGEITGAVNLLVDVTAIKQANSRITESEERFRTMADQAPIIVWITDDTGRCSYINAKWTEVTGARREEAMDGLWVKYVHPDDRGIVARRWNEAFASRQKFRFKARYKTRTGEFAQMMINGSPRYHETGIFAGYIGIFEDITKLEDAKNTLELEVTERTRDLLKRNEQLRLSEERYHKMVAEVEDYAIILLSKDGVIENWNRGAEKIKGYTAAQVVGKSFQIFYTEDDRKRNIPQKNLEEAAGAGRVFYEGLRVRADGTTFWGSIALTALHDTNNNVIGFTKVTRNLSEINAAEDALRSSTIELAEKNRELEMMNQELASFAYVSSHDLQEPLRKIQTFASRIVETEHDNLSPKGKDYFIRIQNAALRMQTLIEDLLAYSRTNTADKDLELVDLNKVVADVKTELRETIDEKSAIIECGDLPTLTVIAFQLRQLITNLLSNALKFSKPDVRPHIRVDASLVHGRDVPVKQLNSRKAYHHITVADNGIGFEPEYSQKIFEVFQRLHGRSEYSGTGIGLAICKKIAENHGGLITVDAQPDQGATFHVYLPKT